MYKIDGLHTKLKTFKSRFHKPRRDVVKDEKASIEIRGLSQ